MRHISIFCILAAAALALSCHKSDRGYDVAAYVWPAFYDSPRWAELGIFPDGKGEWETVYSSEPRYEGHRQPRVPEWGYFNEADPKMQEKIIKAATKYGVNTFIFDWYWYDGRPFLEDVVNAFLKARNNEKMKFYLMWANHTATSGWDRTDAEKSKVFWLGEKTREEFDVFTDHLVNDYFTKPNYYKIDGKPVFAIYEIGTFINGMGGLDQAKDALDALRQKCVDAGLPGLHVQAMLIWTIPTSLDGVLDETEGTQANTLSYLGIESVTHYQWAHYVALKDYKEWGEEAVSKYKDFDSEFDIPYFPHVSVDWDNNPRYPCKVNAVTGSNPELFETFLEKAKEYVDAHPDQVPLITINSWNEWAEGSYLEPDKDFGYGYLEAVRKVFKEDR